MATSLAASIRDHFGIGTDLVEGHEGIFEVSINGDKVYTNKSECSILPKTNEILEKIHMQGGSPLKSLSTITPQELSLEGATCPLPGTPPDIKKQMSSQQTITGLQDDRTTVSSSGTCGCDCKSC